MSIGLLGLLDDIAAIAKVAAATLDDVAALATKAGAKVAAVVIDDAVVTPRYVFGFSAKRELPIVARIAAGSLRNKLLVLLPATLATSPPNTHTASHARGYLSILRRSGRGFGGHLAAQRARP
jgi:predicted DNA repair protein MutK